MQPQSIVDLETDTEYTVHADKIINATGVWTENTQKMCPDANNGLQVLASKGNSYSCST